MALSAAPLGHPTIGATPMIASMFAALAAVALTAADPAADAKKDLDKLQGTWIMAELEVEGAQVAPERLRGTKLVVKGDKYIVTVKNESHETVITLDPTKKPKAIDMVFRDGPNKDKVHRGIYEVNGDTFKLCRGREPEAERPKEFGSWPDTGVFLVVWKREGK
jgi:uncharacterized protein (TIGR03067 family)